MGICWHCHWGWPDYVADIYNEALERLEGDIYPLNFGPAHIVWEDENWDSVDWCLENFDKHTYEDYSAEQLEVVRWSLQELAKIPLEKRDLEPEDYDEEHPENFPPPEGVRMVK